MKFTPHDVAEAVSAGLANYLETHYPNNSENMVELPTDYEEYSGDAQAAFEILANVHGLDVRITVEIL